MVPVTGLCTNWTSRPTANVMPCPMMMPSPQVARMASSGREYSGFITRRSMIMPHTKPMTKAHSTDHHGFRPSLVISNAE
jgi:hypothetical protein